MLFVVAIILYDEIKIIIKTAAEHKARVADMPGWLKLTASQPKSQNRGQIQPEVFVIKQTDGENRTLDRRGGAAV